MKQKKIPKFKRSKSVFVKLEPSCTKYDFVYVNYVETKEIPGDFKMGDLLELLAFFRKKGSTVFVSFYEPKPPERKEEPKEPEKEEDNHEGDNEVREEGASPEAADGGADEPIEEPEEEQQKKKRKKRRKR